MSAEVQSQPQPPEIKTLDRVASIPIVHDSLNAIHQTLTTYTPTAYAYGQAISTSAYSLSTPIQVRLAPLIVSADGYALKGLDAAQARFPAPFTVKTEEVIDGIKTRRDSAVNAVTQPVYNLASGVDSSLAPIVDRIEEAIHKLGPAPGHVSDESTSSEASASSSSSTDTTQVARLYSLSLDLRAQIYNLSSEQIKQLQSQNSYIQTATEKVHTLNANLTASYGAAKDKSLELVAETRSQAQVYVGSILQELEKIQGATMDLPKQLQAKLQPVQEGIRASLVELTDIVKSDVPVGEKVSKVGAAVQEKVHPLLEQTTQTIQTYIAEAKAYIGVAKAKATEEANGSTEPASS